MQAQATQSQNEMEQAPDFSNLLAEWTTAAAGRLKASVKLVLAETRLAVSTFFLMIFVFILAAGAFIMAWGLLVYSLIVALSLTGLQLLTGLSVLVLAHLGAGVVLLRLSIRLGRHMEFTATRRLLGPSS